MRIANCPPKVGYVMGRSSKAANLDRLRTARDHRSGAQRESIAIDAITRRLHVAQMRLHTTLAGALISATAALESVPADAFQSVARGRVAVVDDFLARDVVAALRSDAEELWRAAYLAEFGDRDLVRGVCIAGLGSVL